MTPYYFFRPLAGSHSPFSINAISVLSGHGKEGDLGGSVVEQ
jgi:hypothetical protein